MPSPPTPSGDIRFTIVPPYKVVGRGATAYAGVNVSEGFSLTALPDIFTIILRNTVSITAGQILLPSNAKPGQRFTICSFKPIATLTLSAPGATNVNQNTVQLNANNNFKVTFIFELISATWV